MGAVLTLARKDLRVLSRDGFAMFWTLAFPLVYALFFGAIFGDEGDEDGRGRISVALVDEDGSAVSAALVQRLAEHESVSVSRDEAGATVLLHALADAQEQVRKGRLAAYLRIPAGWGDDPYRVYTGGQDGLSLELGVDPGRQAEAGFLQGILMEATFGGLSERFRDPAAMQTDIGRAREEIAKADDLSPVQKLVLGRFLGAVQTFVGEIDPEFLAQGPGGGGDDGGADLVTVVDVTRERGHQPHSTFEITFPQASVWGLMSVAIGFAITIVRERTTGTLLRLRIAPITRAQLIAGKGLGCFLACVLMQALLVVFARLALGVRIGDPLLAGLAMACTSVCFTGLMMTVSVMGKTENAVAGASWGLLMPFAMIGGGMIPLIAMPDWLITASNFSPFKWAILAMEGAVWRGFTLGDMALPCGVLLGIGAVFFALGVAIFRRIDG